ncbi:MAG: hypothetical protein SGI88_05850 [Candidatus Hydrogenedentes bacterium]|nr:hypothetical protein [Candidatus Hydrogenedentota bacterium]
MSQKACEFIEAFRVPRSESGADTPQSKALRAANRRRKFARSALECGCGVAAAFHFLGKGASQFSVIVLVSIHLSLKADEFIEAFRVSEVKAALTRRSPRCYERPIDVENPREAPWSAAAGSCRFPFPGQSRFAIKRDCTVFIHVFPKPAILLRRS